MFNKTFEVKITSKAIEVKYTEGNKILSSLSQETLNKDELGKFFSQNKWSKISILITDSNREETLVNLAHLSKKEAEKHAKLVLKENYTDNFFKAYTKTHNHLYRFITIPITPFIRDCLNIIMEQKNRINAVFCLLDETSNNQKLDRKNKNLLKLHNPSISPIILTEMLNFYLTLMISGGIILMIIIFFSLWQYEHSLHNKLELIHEIKRGRE